MTFENRTRSSGPALVTGASGFLGKHLLPLLGPDTRALVRHSTLALERAEVEVTLGSVCDEAACRRALEGVEQVYHLAGRVSRCAEDGPELYRLHVEGTRTLLQAAVEMGVRRVVVVSTSGTVAVSLDADEVSDETSPYRNTTVTRWPYYLSKIYQEQTALAMGQALGLEVVIVGPSLLLGPGDDRGSSTGDVERVVLGRMPVVPAGGGLAFVDVRDAARGCVLAMERGEPGQRYLLSACNMTLESFVGRVARLGGVTTPRAWLSPRVFRRLGGVVEAFSRVLDTPAPIDRQSLEMAEHTWYVDSSRAQGELGWAHRDPQETLRDTVRDIQRRHGRGPGANEDFGWEQVEGEVG